MDFNSTIDLIIKELREASDIIEDLKRYPDVPALQVELAKLKCKNAGEVIALLKTIKITPQVQVNPIQPKTEQIAKPAPVPEVRPVIREENPVQQPAVQKKAAPVSEIRENPAVVPVTEKKKEKKKEYEQTIIADKFSKAETSFYDQLGASKSEEELAEQLQSRPITSLTDAIGLNDKFLFIREIFSGNNNVYSQAISRLENVSTLSDARAVIMSYTGENTENEAMNQLLELVKRKLPPNE